MNPYILPPAPQPDKSWTLFLDRDGVINEEILGSYVTDRTEFDFCPGALRALARLNQTFGNILVVTNQRGVGRGIMTTEQLKDIHHHMEESITGAGGRLDRIYACTALDDNDHNRKPNCGMALQAKQDFPEIDFRKSIMVGNSLSDMEFGKRMGMYTVFITTKLPAFELPNDYIDAQFPSLDAWAESLKPAGALMDCVA